MAPEVAAAFDDLVAMRPAGVGEELLADAAVVAFAEQFGVDVSVIDDDLRAAFTAATGPALFAVVQVVYVADVAPRLRSALDALFGGSAWAEPRVQVTGDSWSVVDGFMKAVARLRNLDATTTELVRLRGARQHECRVCKSRRSVAAIDQGAGDATFAAVDDYAGSDLPDRVQAALALTDAMIWTPSAIAPDVVDGVHAHLSPAEAVEVVLDVIRNAANKIAVSLAADAAEVTEGVQLFETDADGNLTVV
ncbi:MAG: hypothetical protein JWO11_1670 [Nocardioides sp.]|nr:hypothetical protein [Nocardioides sp.]